MVLPREFREQIANVHSCPKHVHIHQLGLRGAVLVQRDRRQGLRAGQGQPL